MLISPFQKVESGYLQLLLTNTKNVNVNVYTTWKNTIKQQYFKDAKSHSKKITNLVASELLMWKIL